MHTVEQGLERAQQLASQAQRGLLTEQELADSIGALIADAYTAGLEDASDAPLDS